PPATTVEEQVTVITISPEQVSATEHVSTPRRSFSEFEDHLTHDLPANHSSAPSSFAGAPSQLPSSSCRAVMTESDIERGGEEIKIMHCNENDPLVTVFLSFIFLFFINHRPTMVFFAATDPSHTASRGLDPAVVKSLPVFTFSGATQKDPIDCAVCLSEFEDGEPGRVLPGCKHAFHTPRRIFSEFEDGLTRNSPVNHSPMSRMLSFTRMVSRNRRSAPSSFSGAPSQSPSSSCQVVMNESDIERGGEEIKSDFRHVGVP
ncbi:hypothetical protein HID58_043930, partial [Brassica napus]